jgi:hypothetical protein
MSVFDQIRKGCSASKQAQANPADVAARDQQQRANINSGNAWSGLAGLTLGVFGALSAPALLPRGDGSLKVPPEIGSLSLDKLVGIGIRPVEIEGVVRVVTIRDVPGGSELSFEIKSPGADQGIEVVHVIPDFKGETHTYLRHFLEQYGGKLKHCTLTGYITQGAESKPVVDVTSLTFSPPDQPHKRQPTSNKVSEKPWTIEDLKNLTLLLPTGSKK